MGAVILDMPYGGRRGDRTFSFDHDNARLRSLGVLFTPRMAGYTIDSYTRGVEQVADAINRRLLDASAAMGGEQLNTEISGTIDHSTGQKSRSDGHSIEEGRNHHPGESGRDTSHQC